MNTNPNPNPAPAELCAIAPDPRPKLKRVLSRLWPYRHHDVGDLPAWAKDCLYVETVVSLSFADRLRVLVSGRLRVRSATFTENVPGKAVSTSLAHPLPPAAIEGEGLGPVIQPDPKNLKSSVPLRRSLGRVLTVIQLTLIAMILHDMLFDEDMSLAWGVAGAFLVFLTALQLAHEGGLLCSKEDAVSDEFDEDGSLPVDELRSGDWIVAKVPATMEHEAYEKLTKEFEAIGVSLISTPDKEAKSVVFERIFRGPYESFLGVAKVAPADVQLSPQSIGAIADAAVLKASSATAVDLESLKRQGLDRA